MLLIFQIIIYASRNRKRTNKENTHLMNQDIIARCLTSLEHKAVDFELSSAQKKFPANFENAAVLVLIIGYRSGPKVVLTKRSESLPRHPGQISFPGGRVDEKDEDLESTALRETFEEIGVSREQINILGRLPYYDVLTGFRVTPFVGWIENQPLYRPDPGEVEEVFELPLDHILNPKNHKLHLKSINGRDRNYFSISYQDWYVWGATAGILVNLYKALNTQNSDLNSNN